MIVPKINYKVMVEVHPEILKTLSFTPDSATNGILVNEHLDKKQFKDMFRSAVMDMKDRSGGGNIIVTAVADLDVETKKGNKDVILFIYIEKRPCGCGECGTMVASKLLKIMFVEPGEMPDEVLDFVNKTKETADRPGSKSQISHLWGKKVCEQ